MDTDMIKNEIKLKQCPVCRNSHIDICSGDEGGFYIECPVCNSSMGKSHGMNQSIAIGMCTYGEFETITEAIEKWGEKDAA